MQHFLNAIDRVLVSSDAPHSADREARKEDRQIRQSADKVVLVVDDDAAMRWVICEYLRQMNLSVIEAVTAADSYEQILQLRDRVSVLITDMVIPGGGGWQLVQRARQVIPDLAVIFISGTIGEQVVASAISHSRTGFLEKPFAFSQLHNLLHTLLSEATGKKDGDKMRREIECDQKAG